jgi:ABC-type transporter Mla MlaB component
MAARAPRTIDLPCDVRGVEADAVTVNALAGLQLAARRHGCRIHLRHASTALVELIDFMGLSDVLPNEPRNRDGEEVQRAGRCAPYRGRK